MTFKGLLISVKWSLSLAAAFVSGLAFLGAASPVFAQENNSEKPLKEVFALLQKQYNIQFNFAEDQLTGKSVERVQPVA